MPERLDYKTASGKTVGNYGLRLTGFDLAHPRDAREPSRIPAATDRRQICGAAFFATDPDRAKGSPEDLHRAGTSRLRKRRAA